MELQVAPHIIIRQAHESDAPAMGKMMVETFLRAHRGQIPDEVWRRRKEEWTWEVSARGWRNALQDIAGGSSPAECIFLAVIREPNGPGERIVGLVMGGPARVGPWEAGGEIYALYVRQDYHRQGIGRRLVQAGVRSLVESGMEQLVIRSLPQNDPANRFYEALGGQAVGEWEDEDYGMQIPQRIYGWEDSLGLLEV